MLSNYKNASTYVGFTLGYIFLILVPWYWYTTGMFCDITLDFCPAKIQRYKLELKEELDKSLSIDQKSNLNKQNLSEQQKQSQIEENKLFVAKFKKDLESKKRINNFLKLFLVAFYFALIYLVVIKPIRKYRLAKTRL